MLFDGDRCVLCSAIGNKGEADRKLVHLFVAHLEHWDVQSLTQEGEPENGRELPAMCYSLDSDEFRQFLKSKADLFEQNQAVRFASAELERRFQPDHLNSSNVPEFTADPNISVRQLTILVDKNSQEIVQFMENYAKLEVLFKSVGFHRFTPCDVHEFTASENEVMNTRIPNGSILVQKPKPLQKRDRVSKPTKASDAPIAYYIDHQPLRRADGHRKAHNFFSALCKSEAAAGETEELDMDESNFWNILKNASASRSEQQIHYAVNVTPIVNHVPATWMGNLRYSPLNGLRSLTAVHGGINTPTAYFGMRGSLFALHVEDGDLGSTNQLIYGCAKVWLIFRPEDYEKIVDLIAKLWREFGFRDCKNPTRHKSLFIHPRVFREAGIRYSRIVQRPGEIIVLHPRAFHAGYNVGFNVAHAVNFWPQAIELKEKLAFQKATIECDCGAENLRFASDFKSMVNECWAKNRWVPASE